MENTSQLFFIEIVRLEHSAIPGDETALCVLGDLVGGVDAVQYDLREYIVRPAAYPEIQVVLNLTREHVGVRALCGEDQVNAKGPSQAR